MNKKSLKYEWKIIMIAELRLIELSTTFIQFKYVFVNKNWKISHS